MHPTLSSEDVLRIRAKAGERGQYLTSRHSNAPLITPPDLTRHIAASSRLCLG